MKSPCYHILPGKKNDFTILPLDFTTWLPLGYHPWLQRRHPHPGILPQPSPSCKAGTEPGKNQMLIHDIC